MKRFAELFRELDTTNSTLGKVDALVRYFRDAPGADAAWGAYFLLGEKLPSVVKRKDLTRWCLDLTGLPEWLVRESRASVGDLAETVTLLLEDVSFDGVEAEPQDVPLHEWVDRIRALRGLSEMWQRIVVFEYWASLDSRERFVFNKLLTGAFRVGVARNLVVRALARHAGVDDAVMAHRLAGSWQPGEEAWERLVARDTELDVATPYPFFLATPLNDDPAALGSAMDWGFEWKWDGIRGQVIKRKGEVVLWSRGNELLTHRFPEVVEEAQRLPDGTVLDGEILAFADGAPLAFSALQTRIQRERPTQEHLEAAPVVYMAYDILERDGVDVRELPLWKRRESLEATIPAESERLRISELLVLESWEEAASRQAEARERRVEGLIIKDRESPYLVGRKRGAWWKWKVAPHSIDAVLVYAQAGSGRRSNLFTDYTFALWNEGDLVPIAKAYSGLSDEEIGKLDRWIRRNTEQRFGPVRNVKPHHVFELNFDSVQHSSRHRSGIALRFPRIHRWRIDKTVEDANQLSDLEALLDHG